MLMHQHQVAVIANAHAGQSVCLIPALPGVSLAVQDKQYTTATQGGLARLTGSCPVWCNWLSSTVLSSWAHLGVVHVKCCHIADSEPVATVDIRKRNGALRHTNSSSSSSGKRCRPSHATYERFVGHVACQLPDIRMP
jgi:hypothetical protein